ncbi:MAG: RHS repeat-associated core domain-containing protein [Anaerolineales bacterium]
MNRGTIIDSFHYDPNGNMDCRTESGVTYKQNYNADNRISSIAKMDGDCASTVVVESWSYQYDADGVRVSTAHFTGLNPDPDSFTAYYFGGSYEITTTAAGSAWKKYYSFAGQTIMRDAGGFKYFLSDLLGSTAVVLDANSAVLEQQRYLPFGGVRTDLPASGFRIENTDLTYTGQRSLPGTGLMDYNARFYSPSLGRFIQPDNVIPGAGNPQSFNRFSYVINNPLRYTDPTGHAWDDCSRFDSDVKCKRHMRHVAKIKARWDAQNAGSRAGQVGGMLGIGARQRCVTIACMIGGTTWLTPGLQLIGSSGSSGAGTAGSWQDGAPKVLPSPVRDGGEPPTGGEDDSCTLTPAYLCQLSQEDQDLISDGQYYTVDVTDQWNADNRNGAYALIIGLPTVIFAAPSWVVVAWTYLGGTASSRLAKIPGTQVGDIMVQVSHAVGEEFEYRGHTYNTEVITNTYYFRDDKLIWTGTDVTIAYPTSRTY